MFQKHVAVPGMVSRDFGAVSANRGSSAKSVPWRITADDRVCVGVIWDMSSEEQQAGNSTTKPWGMI